MYDEWSSVVVPSETRGCLRSNQCSVDFDRTMRVGINTFHVLANAIREARWRNERAQRKEYRIVVDRNHFLVVDRTWERNDG